MWGFYCILTTWSGIPSGCIYFGTDISVVGFYHVEFMCMCFRRVWPSTRNRSISTGKERLRFFRFKEPTNPARHIWPQTQAKLHARGELMLQVRSSNELGCKYVQTSPEAHTVAVKWVPVLSPGLKLSGRGADQPPPSSSGVEYG
jgi:hypothetical protein